MPSTYPSPNSIFSGTVSNTSTQVAAANPQRIGLQVYNPSASITLWVAPLGTAAVVNGSGSVAIQPLQAVMFGPPNTPNWTQGMNAIASSAGTNPCTVYEYYT